MTRTRLAGACFSLAAGVLAYAATDQLPEWRPLFRDFGGGVTLRLTAKPFIANKHKLGWCDGDGYKYVCTIDGQPFFGTAGQPPVSQLDSAVFKYGSHTVHLDVSCMYDPWTKDNNTRLKMRKTTEGYRVSAELSDGDGGYYAEWLVIGDGSIRTTLGSTSEEEEPAEEEQRQ